MQSFGHLKYLVEMIQQHFGDFPKRLHHTTAKYEYCPIPGISYPRLEKELFCHSYYLRNLFQIGRLHNQSMYFDRVFCNGMNL